MFTGVFDALSNLMVGMAIGGIALFASIILITFFVTRAYYIKKLRFSDADSDYEYEVDLKNSGFTNSISGSLLSCRVFIDAVNKEWSMKKNKNSSVGTYRFDQLLGYKTAPNEEGILTLTVDIEDEKEPSKQITFKSAKYSDNQKSDLLSSLYPYFEYIMAHK